MAIYLLINGMYTWRKKSCIEKEEKKRIDSQSKKKEEMNATQKEIPVMKKISIT